MIHGTVDPRFAQVKDAFASCFADGLEHGAAVAVMLDGKLVADLWGGYANLQRTKAWNRDTLVNVWSATKGVMALAVAMLVERGKLHYDRPIAEIWPEFAQNGKGAITLEQALSHQSGLDGLSVPMDVEGLYLWDPYVDALAAMPPNWEPGSRCVYHAISYGHLAGEPLRRADGRRVGQFVADEIAEPLNVPFYIGLPESEDHRVAELIEGPKASDWVVNVIKSPYPHSCMNPTPVATEPNNRAWRAAEIPGGNGHTDARSLATIYGNLVAGNIPLIAPATLKEATRCRFNGIDSCFETPIAYGAGFRLFDPTYGAHASGGIFGHSGWGGATAFGDTETRLSFAFVTCNMLGFDDGIDPRRQRLVDAVYAAL
jgi:CubicO group peptidase (beta-lactamase class C family)